jgi:hypothetical protein
MVTPTDEIGPIFGHFIHLAPSGGLPGLAREGLLTPKSLPANKNLIAHNTAFPKAASDSDQQSAFQQLRKLTLNCVPSAFPALLNSPNQRSNLRVLFRTSNRW